MGPGPGALWGPWAHGALGPGPRALGPYGVPWARALGPYLVPWAPALGPYGDPGTRALWAPMGPWGQLISNSPSIRNEQLGRISNEWEMKPN